jgi:cytochrome P450
MPAVFDPYDPAHLVDGVPFDLLAELRSECPVSKAANGAWYLAKRADAEAALKDVEGFRADLGPITGLPGFEAVPDDQLFLSELMEPRHGQVRRIYNACFGPHRVREAEPTVRAICADLLDPMLGTEADLSMYAAPIPGRVIAHMMDLPASASDLFMQWSAEGTLMTRPATPGVDGPPIHTYFAGLVTEQRATPTNHIFRLLLEAEVEGAPLTDTEIVTHLHFMVMAGVHTTRGLLTHVVQRLAMEPALYEALAADRSLVPAYVEESLRHDAPVQRTTRRVMRPAEVGGVSIEPGEWVEVGVASANRDEDVYDDPESFRLDRPEPRDHLAFGAGSHVCPGATLARLEAVAAVEALLDRVASIELVDGATYPPVPGNLGHAPIPVVLTAR